MNKIHCDSCLHVTEDPVFLKKFEWSWYEGWWIKVDLCKTCYTSLKKIYHRK